MEDKIGLSDMVTALRHELTRAQTKGESETLKFTVEDIEIELQIASEKIEKGGVGVKFWVVNSSLDLSDKSVITQKLRLKLKVKDENGDPIDIAAESD